MGTLWCGDLPTVDIPQTDAPKSVTLILPYYENPRFLRQHLAWWSTYPAHLRQRLSVIVVDDGSPDAPAASVLATVALPLPVRLFRLGLDVRWNWLAARNIGAHQAAPGWLLLTDMDHVLPVTTLQSIVYGQHDAGTIYGFSRIEHTGEALAPHPNSWLMTRDMFWQVGGYDERMSGYYGSDGYWRRRMADAAPMKILSDRLVRHEYQGDSSTLRYKRKQPEDARLKAIVAAFPKGSKPLTLSFPYQQVAL